MLSQVQPQKPSPGSQIFCRQIQSKAIVNDVLAIWLNWPTVLPLRNSRINSKDKVYLFAVTCVVAWRPGHNRLQRRTRQEMQKGEAEGGHRNLLHPVSCQMLVSLPSRTLVAFLSLGLRNSSLIVSSQFPAIGGEGTVPWGNLMFKRSKSNKNEMA